MPTLRRLIDEEVLRVLKEEGATKPPSSTTPTSSGTPSKTPVKQGSGTLPGEGEKGTTSSGQDPFSSDQPEQQTPDSSSPEPEEEEQEKTPEQEVMDMATQLSQQTRDVPTILKGIKATMLKRNGNLSQAGSLITSLEGSQDETLRMVAVQLKRFVGV